MLQVVGQIDKLTSDFDFDLEPDDWTVATASSTSSSERGLGEAFRLDFLNADVLSDSWEFCSYLEAAGAAARRSSEQPGDLRQDLDQGTTASVYSQMNGGLPIPNGPRIITPDSSSEEASSSTHSQKTSRTSGTRERVRFSDKILYHALCCDDDEEEEQEELREDKSGYATPDSDTEPGLLGSLDPSYGSSPVKAMTGAHTLPRKGLLNPGCRKKLLRNSSTQTVSDKSTQTVLPYIPTKQKAKDH
uniref:Inhibitory synaptic factor 1 n=1 Tax=Poecilia formosa TaxID=48698 RepID=A0A087YDX1_POEFO